MRGRVSHGAAGRCVLLGGEEERVVRLAAVVHLELEPG